MRAHHFSFVVLSLVGCNAIFGLDESRLGPNGDAAGMGDLPEVVAGALLGGEPDGRAGGGSAQGGTAAQAEAGVGGGAEAGAGAGADGDAGAGGDAGASGSGGETSGSPCDPTECAVVGNLCRDEHTRVTCAKDVRGCLYVSELLTCVQPQSCSGVAPRAACALDCTDSCLAGQVSCVGATFATCGKGSNGCLSFGAGQACPGHQACAGPAGTAACACTQDPVCKSVGNTCATTSTLAGCTQDSKGCVYQVSSSTCTNGACSAGACCTNACTAASKKCSTSLDALESCNIGGNGCSAWDEGTCATGNVCERLGTPACLDPTWAQWPMPNSQTDSNKGAPTLASYKDNGDGTVTDNLTALVWQQAAGGTYDAAGAVAYCADLDFAGYQNWRLPSVVELISLLDFDHSPLISPTYFPNATADWFRTSERGWVVSFGNGSTGFTNAGLKDKVRCVR